VLKFAIKIPIGATATVAGDKQLVHVIEGKLACKNIHLHWKHHIFFFVKWLNATFSEACSFKLQI
jgi:hypothetical protein